MTLRWQDVAGQLRGADLSTGVEQVTQGLAGLGDSVQRILLAPEQRRRDALNLEAKVQGMNANTYGKGAEVMADLSKTMKENEKRELDEIFGAAQSEIGAVAQQLGASGQSFDNFLKSDAYLNLDPRVRSRIGEYAFAAYSDGADIRDREEQQAESRRQWQANYALNVQQERRAAASAARDAEMDRYRLKELKRADEEAEKQRRSKIYSNDPETQSILSRERDKIAKRAFEALGGAYAPGGKLADKSIPDIAKGMDREDIAEATAVYESVNNYLRNSGRPEIPLGVFKQSMERQIGVSQWNPLNDFDSDAMYDYLVAQSDKIGAISAAEERLFMEIGNARRGEKLTSKDADRLFGTEGQDSRMVDALKYEAPQVATTPEGKAVAVVYDQPLPKRPSRKEQMDAQAKEYMARVGAPAYQPNRPAPPKPAPKPKTGDNPEPWLDLGKPLTWSQYAQPMKPYGTR